MHALRSWQLPTVDGCLHLLFDLRERQLPAANWSERVHQLLGGHVQPRHWFRVERQLPRVLAGNLLDIRGRILARCVRQLLERHVQSSCRQQLQRQLCCLPDWYIRSFERRLLLQPVLELPSWYLFDRDGRLLQCDVRGVPRWLLQRHGGCNVQRHVRTMRSRHVRS